jgi:hypothetical protein
MSDSDELQDACRNCGSVEHLRDGLCRECVRILGREETAEAESREHPHQAPVIPLHRPPWRRRGT